MLRRQNRYSQLSPYICVETLPRWEYRWHHL